MVSARGPVTFSLLVPIPLASTPMAGIRYITMPSALLLSQGATVTVSPLSFMLGHEPTSGSGDGSVEMLTTFVFARIIGHDRRAFGCPSSSVPAAELSGQLELCSTTQSLGTEIFASL